MPTQLDGFFQQIRSLVKVKNSKTLPIALPITNVSLAIRGSTDEGHAKNRLMDWRSFLNEATVRQNSTINILVVDEDELSLALIKSSLEIKGYDVHLSLNCRDALTASASQPFSLIICDCDMRVSTGVPVESLIHSCPRNREVPFLYTSSSQTPDVISRRRNDRNVFYVRKPFEHEAFLNLTEFAMWRPQLIRSHIERIHLQQGLNQPHSFPQQPSNVIPEVKLPAFGIAPIQVS